MRNWLLAPVAAACLVAGLAPLGVALLAGGRGFAMGLADPALAPSLHGSVVLAASLCPVGLVLGLTGAFCLLRAERVARAIVLAIAILVLVVPAPPFTGFPDLTHLSLRALAQLGCAVSRGAALVLLTAAPAAWGIPPTLRRAAQSAGATPFQAWCHAVLAPLWVPSAMGVMLAFLAALVQTPAAVILAPHLDMADAWVAPASLLLVACSATALGMLARRPA